MQSDRNRALQTFRPSCKMIEIGWPVGDRRVHNARCQCAAVVGASLIPALEVKQARGRSIPGVMADFVPP